jgi:hypothetical protein
VNKQKPPAFPQLSQVKMAAFLGIQPVRLKWATREGIVKRNPNGSYSPETVTGQWLAYERKQTAKREGRGVLERERIRLIRAKATAAEVRLAAMNRSLISADDIVDSVRTVCTRIRTKLQAALPRLARGCYHSSGVDEALRTARTEFDILLAELSALDSSPRRRDFEVVANENENGESSEN